MKVLVQVVPELQPNRQTRLKHEILPIRSIESDGCKVKKTYIDSVKMINSKLYFYKNLINLTSNTATVRYFYMPLKIGQEKYVSFPFNECLD